MFLHCFLNHPLEVITWWLDRLLFLLVGWKPSRSLERHPLLHDSVWLERIYVFMLWCLNICGPIPADSFSKRSFLLINGLFGWGSFTFFFTGSDWLLIKGICLGLNFLLFDWNSQPIKLFWLIFVVRIIFKFHMFAFAFRFNNLLLTRPETGQSWLFFSFDTVRVAFLFSCFSLCTGPHRLQRGRLKRNCAFGLHLFLFWFFFFSNWRPSNRRGWLSAFCISSAFSSLI